MIKNPIVVWFFVGLVMLLMEMATPGLVFLFFGVGAWIVVVLLLVLKISLNVQLGIFLIASLLSLALFRNMLKKAFQGNQIDEKDLGKILDEFVGHKAVVIEKIDLESGGKVEFKGSQWEAESEEEIAEGEMVKILSKDNLTLKVEKL